MENKVYLTRTGLVVTVVEVVGGVAAVTFLTAEGEQREGTIAVANLGRELT